MGIFFASVVLVVAVVWVTRRMRASAAKRRAATGPGSSIEHAIPVRSFDAIDTTVRQRRCHCGEALRLTGEGARDEGAKRYRIARLACDECEEDALLYFDVTEVLH